MTRRPFPLALGLLLLAAAPSLAQEDLVVTCEVYRFDEAARAKLAANKGPLDLKLVRSLGQRRFDARLPVRMGESAVVQRARRFAFRTQTVNNVASQTNIQFLDVVDSFSCSTREDPRQQRRLQIDLKLDDVEGKTTSGGLPVVSSQRQTTQVELVLGRDVVLTQGSAKAEGQAFQVTVVRVERLPAGKGG